MVTTRASSCKKEFCDATARAMNLAKQKRYAQAIREFIQYCHSNADKDEFIIESIRMDYLILHMASIISLQEFETCLCRLFSKFSKLQ